MNKTHVTHPELKASLDFLHGDEPLLVLAASRNARNSHVSMSCRSAYEQGPRDSP